MAVTAPHVKNLIATTLSVCFLPFYLPTQQDSMFNITISSEIKKMSSVLPLIDSSSFLEEKKKKVMRAGTWHLYITQQAKAVSQPYCTRECSTQLIFHTPKHVFCF